MYQCAIEIIYIHVSSTYNVVGHILAYLLYYRICF